MKAEIKAGLERMDTEVLRQILMAPEVSPATKAIARQVLKDRVLHTAAH